MPKNHPNILYFETDFDYPLIVKGEGVYLYDEDGKRYIDGCAGSISTSLGYGREEMAEVMRDQALEISFVHRHHVSSKIVNEATDVLKKNFPAMDKFFLVSGGTEATECATKLARLHFYHQGKPEKNKIIGRWMSYHGYTTDALAYGGNPGRRKEFAAILREDGHIMPPYCYRCWAGKNPETCGLECANELENVILTAGPDTVAAFICETVVGTTMGCVTPPEGYYKRIREICDKYNVLMILDEVMCGSGRTGTMLAMLTEKYQVLLIFDEVQALRLSEGGAQKRYGVTPDIAAFGKIIGGGLPVGAVGGRREIMAVFDATGKDPVTQSGTFNGNRTTMAAGYAALIQYRQADCDRLEQLAVRLQTGMEDGIRAAGMEGCVTRAGSLLNYHFVKGVPRNYTEVTLENKELCRIIHLEMLRRGIFLAPRGLIALSTPMDETVIDSCIEAFRDSLASISSIL